MSVEGPNRPVTEIRRRLQALLEQHAAGAIDEQAYLAQRAALGESALTVLAAPRMRVLEARQAMLGIVGVLLLVGAGVYLWPAVARHVEHPPAPDGAAGPIDHGPDMQTAIANLAEKLRLHPADAAGWVLLGRTYRAIGREQDAHAAFQHAVAAAPGDAAIARELSAPPAGVDADLESDADLLLGQSSQTASSDSGRSGDAKDDGVVVHVALDAKLIAQANAADAVFVFAKAAAGPPMPLAVARLTVAQLPATVKLTDAMGMVAGLKLSQFPQIVVGAHISKSGDPATATGDLQSPAVALATRPAQPVQLMIDQIR